MVQGQDSTWPFSVQQQKMPVNLRVLQLSTSGPGRVVEDNTSKIGGLLAVGAHTASGCDCSLTQSPGPLEMGGLALLLLGYGVLRISRRRRG